MPHKYTDKIELSAPLTRADIAPLRAGDRVLISGVIYTARDVAHRRIVEALEQGNEPPFPLEGQIIYYTGPSPTRPGEVTGSAGPTTSGRMDKYSPTLIEAGLRAMIGKGKRSQPVIESMIRHGAVYLGVPGGIAALLAKHIKSCEVIAYPELGPEAVRKLVVEKFPTFVINDVTGRDLYDEGAAKYSTEKK